jgi:hypothetical protein
MGKLHHGRSYEQWVMGEKEGEGGRKVGAASECSIIKAVE